MVVEFQRSGFPAKVSYLLPSAGRYIYVKKGNP